MQKRNKKKKLQGLIVLSLTLSLIGGAGQVTSFAESTISLEKMYETDRQDDNGNGRFESTYEKDGILYGLSHIQTEIVETIITSEDQYLWESSVFIDEPANHAPPLEVKKENGTYRLHETKLLSGTADGRSQYAQSDSIFKLEYTDNLAEIRQVSIKDEDTGQEVKRPLPFIKSQNMGTYWDDNFFFPITVEEYDAEAFLLGDILVPSDAPLIDYADELLNYLGLPAEYYRITNISWMGSAYEENGVLIRKAEAAGEKLITEVKATYGGNIALTDVAGQYYQCTYVKEGTTTGTIYRIKAVATYEQEKDVVQKSFLEWLLDWILQHPIAAIGIALLLLILLIIIIMFVLGKKDEKKKAETAFIFKDEEEDRKEEDE